jgi:hypothetical protein
MAAEHRLPPSSHRHHTFPPLHPIKDKPSPVRLHSTRIPSPRSDNMKLHCVCMGLRNEGPTNFFVGLYHLSLEPGNQKTQESRTYRLLLHQNQHPVASLQSLPTDNVSHQHDILSRAWQIGHRRGLRSIPSQRRLLEPARIATVRWRGRKGVSGGGDGSFMTGR